MPNAAAADRPLNSQPPHLASSETISQQESHKGLLKSLFVGFVDPASIEVHELNVGLGHAAWVTSRSPIKTGNNEDAVVSLPLNDLQGIMLVADGLGGHRGGHRASQLIKKSISKAAKILRKCEERHTLSKVVPLPAGISGSLLPDTRTIILDEIERTNQRLLRSRTGAATTLSLAEVQGLRFRSYHVGDSETLVISQRGRLKFSTISHSPIGYAVESGLMSEDQALFHPDRHLVSNVIGSERMSVEIGPWVELSPKDTVLIASDGLFDNVKQQEVIDCIRKGKLVDSLRELTIMARRRMILPDINSPSKPDDLTILAYRATR